MDQINNLIRKYVTPHSLAIAFAVVVIISACVYAWIEYIKPSLDKKNNNGVNFSGDGGNDGGSGTISKNAVIYYFTASWCPVSKRVFPEWEKFVSENEGRNVNGYTLQTRVVDCEKEKELADQYNIEGYPTVKLVFDNRVVEYDANVKQSTLNEFVNTTLGA